MADNMRQVHTWLEVELVERIDDIARTDRRSRSSMLAVMINEAVQTRSKGELAPEVAEAATSAVE